MDTVRTPLIKGEGGGQDLPKIESLAGGFVIFCQKGGINLKRGGSCRNATVATFSLIYCLITFTLCVGKVKFPLLPFFFSLLSQPCKILIQVFIVLKHCINCIFLIHSGSVQKMLTALFRLVQSTQKTTRTIFFEYQKAICFLILKRFW